MFASARASSAAALVLVLGACAPAPVAPRATGPTTAAWFERAVDRSSAIVVVVELDGPRTPRDLRSALEDALLGVVARSLGSGPDLHRASAAASEMMVAAAPDGDPLIVFRDVPTALDPRSLPAADGGEQWRLGTAGQYVEYNYAPSAGSLFVLADGGWVVGAGTAAQNVKNAFAVTGGAPILPRRSASPTLATLWVPAAALRTITGQRKLRLLAPVLLHATSLDGTLADDAVAEAHFRYPTEDEAKDAHAVLVDAARAFAKKGEPSTAFLGTTQLDRTGATVTARVTIPPEVLTAFAASR